MLFARQTLFLILAVVSCSASDEKIDDWQRIIPYIETAAEEEAVFIVHFFVAHKGKEIRESKRFFKENDQDTNIASFGSGMGDGPGGQWSSQALNMRTKKGGIHIYFRDSAGKRGETHRKIQKAIFLPWDQISHKSEDGEYAFRIQVAWK